MGIIYEERPSDSPYIESISRVRAESDCMGLIPADGNWYLFVMTLHGKTCLTVGGPITRAFTFPQVAGTEWLGIRFKLGTFMPHLPLKNLVDNVIELPEATSNSFYLKGSAWQFPTDANVETFVDRLVGDGVLLTVPVVDAALQGQPPDRSLRSVQRSFLHVTGITHTSIRQIERARQAAVLLRQGVSILDTVEQAGYFDQPHLTRSLKRFMGQTPAQIASHCLSE